MTIEHLLYFLLLLPVSKCNYNDTLADILTNEGLNALQLIKKYGYPLERHWVTTEDGYIVEMHRIPYGIHKSNTTIRYPILITHGSTGSSREFVVMGNKSIAFVLSEGGYDIWLGNARGTVWSRRHKFLNPNYKQFWLFGWHELGVYDYSAEIEYITAVTKHDKIYFIGHSQAGSAFCAMVSEKPEMNDKIRLAILLAPTIYTKHNKNTLLQVLIDNIELFTNIVYSIGLYELPYSPFLGRMLSEICQSRLKFICSGYINLAMGHEAEQVDHRLLPAIVSNLPGGVSTQTFEHYSQIYRAKKFQQFDYGSAENFKRYGSTSPPEYNISKITAPVALVYGQNDVYIDTADIDDFAQDLPNLAFKYLVPYEMWNHVGYLFAKNATELIYNKLIEMMRQY